MKVRGTKLALQVALVSSLLGLAMSLHAQVPVIVGAILVICNKGTVPVEVVSAVEHGDIGRGLGKYYWSVNGVTAEPQHCRRVEIREGDPSYVAFGLTGSNGEWVSGGIDPVPDIGSVSRYFQQEKVIRGAKKVMCAQKDATAQYALDDDFSADCASLKFASRDTGRDPFRPLTSALYFHPTSYECHANLSPGAPPPVCNWAYYYLNIYPNATDRNLHATPGTQSGADGPSAGERDAAEAQALAKLLKAASDAGAAQNRAKRDVEEARLKREQEYNRQQWSGSTQSPGAFDPQWMGKNVVIVGTVSRVEVDKNGSPRWVSIYFKESPDANFVVCSPYPELFQERVGPNLNTLVGKTIEAAGQVEAPYCGAKASRGSVRLVESTQWKVH